MKRSQDEEDLRSGVAFLLLSLIILTFGAFIYFNRPRAKREPVPQPKQKLSKSVGDQLLGVMLRTDEGRIVVDEALKKGNAAKAGIKAGDILLAMDGVPLKVVEGDLQATYAPILDRMKRARLGQKVTLLVQRAGEEAPRTIVVSLAVEAGRGPELRLAKRLIRQTIAQLLQQRRSDGHWPHYARRSEPSVAVTALAAHALRRADEDLTDEQKATLKASLQLLLKSQRPDGGLSDPAHVPQHRVYTSALGLLALSAGDPTAAVGDDSYREPVAKLRAWLIKNQVQEQVPGAARGFDPIDPRYGGWSYHDDFRSSRLRTDVSTARFALQALAADELPDDAPTWQRAGLFLDLIQNHTLVTNPDEPGHVREKALRDGGFSFTPRMSKAGSQIVSEELHVGRSYGSATADGALSLMAVRKIDRRLLRSSALVDDPRVLGALRWLARNYTVDHTPGFGPGSPWREGLHFYYLAALAEAFHRAGLWKIVRPDGTERVWAADVIKLLGRIRQGGFKNASGYMHEDCESIAASFALIALVAARERLAADGSGASLEAGAGPPPRQRDAEVPLPPPGDILARGEALFEKHSCTACHRAGGESVGPTLKDLREVGPHYLAAADNDAARAVKLIQRFVRDPLTVKGKLKTDRKARMVAIPKEQVPDADLEFIAKWLLHR